MGFNRLFSIFMRFGIFSCVSLFAQQSASSGLSAAEARKIIQRIEAGDVNALGEAELSGDRVFVPCLKEQLRNSKAKLHKETSGLQVGLAKAGEAQQLQQISCELNFGDGSARLDAMRKLELVGGWFAISNMAEFLKNDPRYTSVFGGGLGLLQDYALQVLPNLVPPPPPAPPQTQLLDHTKVLKVWNDYFASHQSALSTLKPTGEGVVISDGICGKVLRKDPAIRRKTTGNSGRLPTTSPLVTLSSLTGPFPSNGAETSGKQSGVLNVRRIVLPSQFPWHATLHFAGLPQPETGNLP